MHAAAFRARRRGFSLIELMAVLAIAGIVLGSGLPSFIGFIEEQRLSAAANDLFAAINLARAEALQRGVRVDLVPAGDGTDWTNGWVVMIDRNNNQKADAGDQIIYAHGPAPHGILIDSSFTDSEPKYLSYAAGGHTRTNASSQTRQSGSWLLTLNGRPRRIVINFLGRPRVCNPVTEAATC